MLLSRKLGKMAERVPSLKFGPATLHDNAIHLRKLLHTFKIRDQGYTTSDFLIFLKYKILVWSIDNGY